MTHALGRLLLMPNALDLGHEPPVPLDQVLPRAVIAQAASLGHWVVENAKTARALLKRVDAVVPLARPLQQVHITELPRPPKGSASAAVQAQPHARAAAVGGMPDGRRPDPWHALLAPALEGHDLGLLSEAGLPAVADPGAALVQAAHAAGVPVVPLAGPSALLLALAASGLNGQSFAFVGYLPVQAEARLQRIRALELLSRQQGQTQLAIETPYRNTALLSAMLSGLAPNTRLAVACGLTLPDERCLSMTVAQWRQRPALPELQHPAVFGWLAA